MADERADIREYLVVHQTLRVILSRFVNATERIDPSVLATVLGSRWALFAALVAPPSRERRHGVLPGDRGRKS